MFEVSRRTRNMHLDNIDTLILLTSSGAVALAVQAVKRDLIDHVPRYLLAGMLTWLVFVASKSIEYFQEPAHGITPVTDTFYTLYFTLTRIHLTHVLFCTSLLTCLWINSRRGAYNSTRRVVPSAWRHSGTWSTCRGSCCFPSYTCRRQSDVGVARADHHGVVGLDGGDLRDDMGAVHGSVRPAVAVVGTFLIAALKVRYVMLDFMEPRVAPTTARLFFQARIAVVVLVIPGFWFATPAIT